MFLQGLVIYQIHYTTCHSRLQFPFQDLLYLTSKMSNWVTSLFISRLVSSLNLSAVYYSLFTFHNELMYTSDIRNV